MNAFYKITESLRDQLTEAGFPVLTLGDNFKVDLKRQTIFPYAHIVPQGNTMEGNMLIYTFTIIGVDLVDFNKDDVRDQEDPFYSYDNLQDVLNDIDNRLLKVAEIYRRGDAFDDLVQLNGSPTLDPFMERYENLVAGWELTLVFQVPNNIGIC